MERKRKRVCTDIIYRYTCSNCNVTYYGKTHRHIFTRAVQQMGISNLTGKRLKSVKQSAVSDHQLECNSSIDSNHFDIPASCPNKLRLLIKETLLIKRDQPTQTKPSGRFYLIKTVVDNFPTYIDMLLWNIETEEGYIIIE